MSTNRFTIAMLSAALLLGASVGPTAARRPAPPPAERPLTAQEQAASDRKIAAAEAYVAAADSQSISPSLAQVTSSCPRPESIGSPVVAGDGDASLATTDATTQSCTTTTPSGFLSVSARDQVNGIYCGPAVGQVIANYSWAMGAAANKYTQKTIAGWMRTDVNRGTSAPWLASGLNTATKWLAARAERLDLDRDRAGGPQCQRRQDRRALHLRPLQHQRLSHAARHPGEAA